jgi:transposase InsO family protein
MERESSSDPWSCGQGGDEVSVAAFIASQRTEHAVPHTLSCRALGLSESWFYKWRDRLPTPRQVRRAELADKVREFFDASGGTYGSPRITLDLWAAGYRVSENTVAKLMADLGLAGRKPKRRRSLTKAGTRPAAPDRVRRQFTAVAPNLLWCGDLTEIATDEGKLYLATVLDLFSRQLLGYAMSEHHDANVAVAALNMASANRGGSIDGVIFHSDRGSEGGFNWSSQHLHAEAREWDDHQVGLPRGRDGRRCVRRVDRRWRDESISSGSGQRSPEE